MSVNKEEWKEIVENEFSRKKVLTHCSFVAIMSMVGYSALSWLLGDFDWRFLLIAALAGSIIRLVMFNMDMKKRKDALGIESIE